MSTDEELLKNKEGQDKLLALCEQLRLSDARLTCLALLPSTPINWKGASKIASVLRENKRVAQLVISLEERYISTDGAMQLADFVRDSPSLRGLQLSCSRTAEYSPATASLLLAVIHNHRLTALDFREMHFKQPDLLERILSSTRTLIEFKLVEPREGYASVLAKPLRKGLERNATLESFSWICTRSSVGLEEALFGLSDHSKLTTLTLDGAMNRPALIAIKFFLKATKSLQNLHLTLRLEKKTDESKSLTHVLSGLASNQSLKSVHLQIQGLLRRSTTPSSEWTEMLEKNTTLTMLILDVYGHDGRRGAGDFVRAIAQGLRRNGSLQTVQLVGVYGGSTPGKLAWQRLLQDNKSLKNLILFSCGMTEECFVGLASGLSENSSLETLDVSHSFAGRGGAAALADALEKNVTLTDLNLSGNLIGMCGAPVISKLWRSTSLKRLTLSRNLFGGSLIESLTVFPEGLPKNTTLEYVGLDSTSLTTNDFHCVLESLVDSPVLQHINVADNTIVLDEALAVLLRRVLETTPLRVLDLSSCEASERMSALTDIITPNSTLGVLGLRACSIGDVELLAIGEAMVDNSTIEQLDLEQNKFSNSAIYSFFELLPRMKGLKNIELDISSCDEEAGLKLVDAMKTNTTLERIVCRHEIHFEWEPVEFYLKMNRNGRKYLAKDPKKAKTESEGNVDGNADVDGNDDGNGGGNRPPMPTGAWPLILAKMTFPSERDALFHFLRNKGDLVQCAPPNRKRKASGPVALDGDASLWYDCDTESITTRPSQN